MKKTFTLVSLFLYAVSSFAQISFLNADVPVASWTQKVIKDTLPLPTINFGNKGANQVYDFSAFVPYKYDTIEYRTPTVQQQTNVPGSDLAITQDGINFLFTKTVSAKTTLQGFEGQLFGSNLSAYYNPVPDAYHFPTQYGGTFNGTATLKKTVSGASVNQPSVDSVRLTINTTYFDTIDGWGKTITPIGKYKSLREKRKETTQTQIEVKGTITFGQWVSFSNTTKTTNHYSYLTKETKGSVITFEYDTSAADKVLSVTYSQIPPAAPIAKFGKVNTSGGIVQFTDSTDGYPDTYSWNFGDGSPTSSSTNPNHTYAANGAYNVCLTVTNAGGSNTKCDTVHVTGISAAANNPPVAVNDTTSVLQPSGKVINVGTNDSDPDANTFCVTLVYGSPKFADAGIGNCTSIRYTPDSTFVGKDTCWYVICDNGTPSKCDTAMLIVTSKYNAALLPVASFTKTFLGVCTGLITVNTSTNADSVTWVFKYLNNFAVDSISHNKSSVTFINKHPSNIFHEQVCLTVYNKYGTDSSCADVLRVCEGINDISTSNIHLYPNPAGNNLVIDLSKNEEAAIRNYSSLDIFNAMGQSVKHLGENTQANEVVNISVADLPTGMYVVTLLDAKGARRTVGRFVKE